MSKPSEKLYGILKERFIGIDDLMNMTGGSRATISAHVNGYREAGWDTRREYEKVLRLPDLSLEVDSGFEVVPRPLVEYWNEIVNIYKNESADEADRAELLSKTLRHIAQSLEKRIKPEKPRMAIAARPSTKKRPTGK